MDTLPPHAENDNIPSKHCTGPCGRDLPATLEYFNITGGSQKPGLRSKCKACLQAQRREYLARTEVRQHKLEQAKEYNSRPEVKDRAQKRQKEYLARPEIVQRREDYYSRPEIVQREKSQKKAYHNRPDVQKRRDEHLAKPEIKQHREEWRKTYRSRPDIKDLDRINSHNRRSRKKSVGGTYTHEQILDQLKRQKHKCYYCNTKFKQSRGRYIYHIEHTFPLSRVAGTDIPANSIDYLVLACPQCNLKKGDKFPWEWPEGGRLL